MLPELAGGKPAQGKADTRQFELWVLHA